MYYVGDQHCVRMFSAVGDILSTVEHICRAVGYLEDILSAVGDVQYGGILETCEAYHQ